MCISRMLTNKQFQFRKVFLPEKPFLLIPVTHIQSTTPVSTNNHKSFASCILPAANDEWHWAVSGSWLACFPRKPIIWRPLTAKLYAQPRLASTTIAGRCRLAEKGANCSQWDSLVRWQMHINTQSPYDYEQQAQVQAGEKTCKYNRV